MSGPSDFLVTDWIPAYQMSDKCATKQVLENEKIKPTETYLPVHQVRKSNKQL